jgi:hypothetical protein
MAAAQLITRRQPAPSVSRAKDGRFDPDSFAQQALRPQVKMIEIVQGDTLSSPLPQTIDAR